jgi:hypothetical protein
MAAEACARLAPHGAGQLVLCKKKLMKTYAGIYFFLTNALHHTLTFKQGIIPTVIDQNPFTHCRRPIDMMFHGRSWSVLQA